MILEWHPHIEDARARPELLGQLVEQYEAAVLNQDPDNMGVVVGEATGLIHDRPSAKSLVERITEEAARCLSGGARFLAKL